MLCHRQLKPSIFLGLFMRWGGFGSALNKTAWTSTRAAPEYDWKHWNEHWQWQVFFILKLSLFNPPTWHTVGCYSLWQSLSLVCHTEWIMFDLAAWFCIMSTSCAHRMHLFFGKLRLLCFCIPVKSAAECELCLLTCSLDLRLSPQGFDDQPGVEPQRLLSAQRRHHLIQPITVQLDDLQVETGSQGLQFPQSPLPPMPLPLTLKPTLLQPFPHRLWTLFLLHSQSSMELKHACTNGRQRILKIWGKN